MTTIHPRPLAALLFAALLGVVPGLVHAQGATDDPHPKMPWNPYHGQILRYVPVPPQSVTIEVAVPPAAGEEAKEPKTQQQVVQIPGYTVTETTSGYLIPQRYTLEQVAPGQYQWRLLPAEFRRK